MSPPLNFNLLEGDEYRLDMASSSSSYNEPDEALLRPRTGTPSNNNGQRSGLNSPLGLGFMGSTPSDDDDDATLSPEELRQRLRQTTEEKERLEAWAIAKERAAETIARALLRKVHRLRVALQETELMWRPGATPRPIYTINPPAPRSSSSILVPPRRRPFVPAAPAANRGDPVCMDRSHQGIVAAFEQSVRHTTHAIRAEAARAREAEALRLELRNANKMLSDERGLSRVLTMQAEGLQKVLGVQHDEIKARKGEVADLRRLVQALQGENARLVGELEDVSESTDEGEGEGEGEGAEVEELEGRISELEGQIKKFEELNKALKAQVDEERKTNKKLVKDTEKRVNAEWQERCAAWTKELCDVRAGLTAFETKFAVFVRREQAAKEKKIEPEHQARTQVHAQVQVQMQDFTTSSSSSITDADWDTSAFASPALTADLQARVKVLEQKNRDLEVELANVRHAGAELAGFYPLRRFHRRVSSRAEQDESEMDLVPITTTTSSVSLCGASTASSKKSWHLDVPDADEDIPEFRLPSPVTPLRREKSAPEIIVSFRSAGDGGDENMGEGSVVEGSQGAETMDTGHEENEGDDKDEGEEESMWETTSASEMDSDPWSDGSVANLFM
ncbi:uncharacterized protein F4807DRAFT_472801 [Annulohypoxylon truncatum]|uniref:uncharacterized protein n=1 Tax=Annulohypoxylon truncatum TaxID=327061 RepID=UPI002007D122|nr:uncharacterized protein F4807DRAFT_472801 [Annulohypoxylon truncatum]KAI1211965.1 hypothetical protein F4807DRAFT_472801 [Annulohypoxylon truncatum]